MSDFELSYFLLQDVAGTQGALSKLTPRLDWMRQMSLANPGGGPHPRGACLVYGYSESNPPDWTELIGGLEIGLPSYSTVTYSMVLLLEAKAVSKDGETTSAVMAVTAGAGYSYLPSQHTVPNFGKDVVLNCSRNGDLVELDTERPGLRGKRTAEKLHAPGNVVDFYIFDDLLSVLKIGSKIRSGTKSVSISGGQNVRFKGAANIDELAQACDQLYQFFLDDSNRPIEFSEIEKVHEITSPREKENAIKALYEGITSELWLDLSVMEPAPKAEVLRYELRYKKESDDANYIYLPIADWTTDRFRQFIRLNLKTFSQFESAQVVAYAKSKRDGDNGERIQGSVPLLKHFSYVSEPEGIYKYLLVEGSIYRVAAALHDRVNEEVLRLPVSQLDLPEFDRKVDKSTTQSGDVYADEGKYNARVCRERYPEYSLLDRGECRRRINRSRVEASDIFFDGRLICVKRGFDAAPVSYVCRQAIDSAICLANYPDYWEFVETFLETSFGFNPRQEPSKFIFILALIGKPIPENPTKLSLKAKLALLSCAREVWSRRFGFEVLFIKEA